MLKCLKEDIGIMCEFSVVLQIGILLPVLLVWIVSIEDPFQQKKLMCWQKACHCISLVKRHSESVIAQMQYDLVGIHSKILICSTRVVRVLFVNFLVL